MSVGILSEFQAGNLMCGHSSHVQLRRHERERVMIEGCLGNEYYTIRDLLYQQYAIGVLRHHGLLQLDAQQVALWQVGVGGRGQQCPGGQLGSVVVLRADNDAPTEMQ